jgi:hypothetical protein
MGEGSMIMPTVYAVALFAGGVFVLASFFFGHHDLGGGHDFGHPGDHPDAAGHEHAPDSGVSGIWLPFFSLRFWTYGATFFGLTGTLLHGLGVAGESATLASAAGMGVGCGSVAAIVIRSLSRREVNSLPTELSFVGEEGELLLDVGPGVPGRVRLSVKGSLVDMPATTDARETIARGSKVVVLDVTEGTARVGLKSAGA